jgi:hypothetical protein
MKINCHAQQPLKGLMFTDFLLLGTFVILILKIYYPPLEINHDCAFLIQKAQMVLEGKRLFIDIPAIFPMDLYIYIPSVMISNLLSINVILVFKIYILLLLLWSIVMVRWLILKIDSNFIKESIGGIILCWSIFSLYKFNSFGQREHIFILLYLPFLILRWLRCEENNINLIPSIMVGIGAAIGVCIKPHFIIFFCLTELYWLIATKKVTNLFKPEIIIVVAGGFIYLGHLLLLPSQMTEALFHRWLPLYMSGYEVTNNTQMYTMDFIARRNNLIPIIMILLPFLTVKFNNNLSRLSKGLSFYTLGGVLVYFIQHKGYAYHLIPASSGALLIFAISVAQIVASLSRDFKYRNFYSLVKLFLQVSPIVIVIYIVLNTMFLGLYLLTLLIMAAISTKCYGLLRLKTPSLQVVARYILHLSVIAVVMFLLLLKISRQKIWEAPNLESSDIANVINSYSKEGDSVLFIDPDLTHMYPLLLQMNRKPGSRYTQSVDILFFYNGVKPTPGKPFPYHQKPNIPEEETKFLGELAEDIAKNKPKIIFIPKQCQSCPPKFSIPEYLEKVEFFNLAMSNYQPLADSSNIQKTKDFEVFLLNQNNQYNVEQ